MQLHARKSFIVLRWNITHYSVSRFTTSRYLFAVADVINQYNRVFYDVDSDLVPIYDYVVFNSGESLTARYFFEFKLLYLGPYATTQRPWFQVSDGWTDEYLYTASNVTARTYSASFQNGS